MSLPPCICPDPNGPSGCSCSRSQASGQWLARSYLGPSTLFANPATGSAAPSPFAFHSFSATDIHHAPHEANRFHDPRDFHGNQNIQPTLFPHTPYGISHHLPNVPSQFHHYQPPPSSAPPVTQGIPSDTSPSKANGRKRKNNTTGRGGARKRQRQPAHIIAAPTSTVCGVGPPTAIPTDSNLLENGLPSIPSSPRLPTIAVQPPADSLPAPSSSTQLPSTSYSSLRKPQERSSAATDVWYFCRSSDSELKPANLPSPEQEPILSKKPRSPFVSCKLCTYVFSLLAFTDMVFIMVLEIGKFIRIQRASQQQCEVISDSGMVLSMIK